MSRRCGAGDSITGGAQMLAPRLPQQPARGQPLVFLLTFRSGSQARVACLALLTMTIDRHPI